MRVWNTISIQVDAELYQEVSAICKKVGTTAELLAESFLRFSAVKENLPLIKAFLTNEIAPAEAGAIDQYAKKVIDEVFQMAIDESIKRGTSDTAQH